MANYWAGGSNGNAEYGFKVQHNTTDFTESRFIVEPSCGVCYSKIAWFTVWTAGANEGLKMQFFADNAANTVKIDQITFFAIEISEELTEDTDWFFNHNATSRALDATFTEGATITIASGDHDAGDTYLVLGYGRLAPTSLTSQYETRIARSGEATSTEPTYSREGEDSSENLVQFLVRTFDLGASSNTFEIETRANLASGNYLGSSVFAINLEKFVDSAENWNGTDITLSTTNWATLASNVTMTPTQTGNVTIISNIIIDHGGLSDAESRLQIDNTDQPTGQTAVVTQVNAWDTKDELGHPHSTIESLDTSSHDAEQDASGSGGGIIAEDRQAVMFSMELVSADNCDPSCTQNLNDGIIIGDSLIKLTLFNQTDGVIIGDAVTLTLANASSTSQNDGIIFGDSVTLELTCNVTCSINITDGIIIGELLTNTGATPPSFNALYLRVAPEVSTFIFSNGMNDGSMRDGGFYGGGWFTDHATDWHQRAWPIHVNITVTGMALSGTLFNTMTETGTATLQVNGVNVAGTIVIQNTTAAGHTVFWNNTLSIDVNEGDSVGFTWANSGAENAVFRGHALSGFFR